MNPKVVDHTLLGEILALRTLLQSVEVCLKEIELNGRRTAGSEVRGIGSILEILILLYATSLNISKRWQNLRCESYSEKRLVQAICKEIKNLIDVTLVTISVLKQYPENLTQAACSLQLKQFQQASQHLVGQLEGSIKIH